MRDAPTAEVQDAIKTCNWPEQKAPRIQQILRLVTERRGGELSLDFLEHLPIREARDWLEESARRRAEDQRGGAHLQPVARGGRCRWTAITTASPSASA